MPNLPHPKRDQTYHVHLFPVVRYKVSDVLASSPQRAIEQALAATDLYACCSGPGGEYAEELAYGEVDVVGDDQFAKSRWFTSREGARHDVLQRLLAWNDQGRPEQALRELLREAGELLDHGL